MKQNTDCNPSVTGGIEEWFSKWVSTKSRSDRTSRNDNRKE